MRLVFSENERVAAFVAAQIGVPFFHPPYQAIGWENPAGELVGGAIFNRWNGASIELTIAGRGTVCRGSWRAMAHYAFEQLKARRVTVVVKAGNTRVREMAARFGFKPEAYLEGWFTDDDGVMFGITKETLKHGRA